MDTEPTKLEAVAAKKPPNAGKGRPKGSKNKTTTALREAILRAADEAHPDGSIGYLKWLALTNSSAFASLLGKVLPTTLAGDPDNPVAVSGIAVSFVSPNASQG